MKNGYAYLSMWEGGVKIFDVRNPFSPMEVGRHFIDGITSGVATGNNNDLIYAVNTNSLRIIDVSAPTMPVLVGTYTLTGNDISSVAIGENGNYAYIGGYGGISTFDISQPTAPRLTGRLDIPNSARHIYATGNLLYITALNYQVHIYRTGSCSPALIDAPPGEKYVPSVPARRYHGPCPKPVPAAIP